MRPRDVLRYARDLGWSDPPEILAPAPHTTSPADADRRSLDDCVSLEELERWLAGCERCGLCAQRRTIVFGEGDPAAPLMFIGEGPGAEEDRTGRPFVGQAGRLLDGMIRALGFDRSEVYIANVVKCRPPGNRDPRDEEMGACSPFLDRQVELIRPRVVVALGRIAAQRLTGTSKPVGALRGRWTSYRGIPLLATFHPAYLLRQPLEKRRVWDDLKQVRAKLEELTSGR
jgi:DNA polymerase